MLSTSLLGHGQGHVCGLELEMWIDLKDEVSTEGGYRRTSAGARMVPQRLVVWAVGFRSHVSSLLQRGVGRGGVLYGSVNTLSLPSNPYLGPSQAKW